MPLDPPKPLDPTPEEAKAKSLRSGYAAWPYDADPRPLEPAQNGSRWCGGCDAEVGGARHAGRGTSPVGPPGARALAVAMVLRYAAPWAEDAWRGQRVVFDLCQIGVADAAGLHENEQFAGADRRDGDIIDGNAAVPAIDGGFHRMWDGLIRSVCWQESPPIYRMLWRS